MVIGVGALGPFGDHVKVPAAVAVSGTAMASLQYITGLVTGAFGNAFTVTVVAVDVAEQPVTVFVTTTVYAPASVAV